MVSHLPGVFILAVGDQLDRLIIGNFESGLFRIEGERCKQVVMLFGIAGNVDLNV
jgi:hypothetical protein